VIAGAILKTAQFKGSKKGGKSMIGDPGKEALVKGYKNTASSPGTKFKVRQTYVKPPNKERSRKKNTRKRSVLACVKKRPDLKTPRLSRRELLTTNGGKEIQLGVNQKL